MAANPRLTSKTVAPFRYLINGERRDFRAVRPDLLPTLTPLQILRGVPLGRTG